MALNVLPALIVPSSALLTTISINAFPKILTANVPNNRGGNLSFSVFASFLIVSLISFIINTDYSRVLTVFIISFIYFFDIMNASVRVAKSKVWPDPWYFFE